MGTYTTFLRLFAHHRGDAFLAPTALVLLNVHVSLQGTESTKPSRIWLILVCDRSEGFLQSTGLGQTYSKASLNTACSAPARTCSINKRSRTLLMWCVTEGMIPSSQYEQDRHTVESALHW